jgi:hypothetical protein
MSIDSSSWTEEATQIETSCSKCSLMFPHIFFIRRTMVFLDNWRNWIAAVISFLFLNPSKRLSAISRKHSFTNFLSVKGFHVLTIRLLTLKDDMVALLECDLGFAIDCCSSANFDLSYLNWILRFYTFGWKISIILIATESQITFFFSSFFWQGYWDVTN